MSVENDARIAAAAKAELGVCLNCITVELSAIGPDDISCNSLSRFKNLARSSLDLLDIINKQEAKQPKDKAPTPKATHSPAEPTCTAWPYTGMLVFKRTGTEIHLSRSTAPSQRHLSWLQRCLFGLLGFEYVYGDDYTALMQCRAAYSFAIMEEMVKNRIPIWPSDWSQYWAAPLV